MASLGQDGSKQHSSQQRREKGKKKGQKACHASPEPINGLLFSSFVTGAKAGSKAGMVVKGALTLASSRSE